MVSIREELSYDDDLQRSPQAIPPPKLDRSRAMSDLRISTRF